jgi:hypothetical protein
MRFNKRYPVLVLITILTLLTVSVAHAFVLPNQESKLLPDDGKENDYFGWSVSVDGDTALVGTMNAGENYTGVAYVFVRNGSGWTQEAKLLADDGEASDAFGLSVSLDGDTAVIGAPSDDHNGENHGSAYVFVRNGSTWSQQAKLIPSDGSASGQVSVDGDTILIGGGSGAYVFVRNGSTWSQQAKLLPDDWPYWVKSVSLDGDTALVGAYLNNSTYVFVRSGTTWSQQAKLLANDGEAGDNFGLSVSLNEETALIGANGDNVFGLTSGSAYVFVRSGTTWSQEAKLLASDGSEGDRFGYSVSLDGDTAVVGAFNDGEQGTTSGSVYIFERSESGWSQLGKLLADDGAAGHFFGLSVSANEGTVLIGAPYDDDQGLHSGSAYVFGENINLSPTIAADNSEVTVNEGTEAQNNGTVSDPNGDAVTLSASVGTVDNNSDGSWSWSYVTSDGPADSQTVTITADDGNGGTAQTTFELAVTNIEPTIDQITVPSTPIDINNQPISVSGTFTDPAGASDQPYTCTVDYGDGNGPQDGTITDKTCKGLYQIYAEPGVYQITMDVKDKDGGTGSVAATDLVVIYDPSGGFVTGGGWITSPEGACQFEACTSDTTGKANFGFVSKYKKGAKTPTGRTEFQFKAGGLNFHSSSYDWLVIAGPNAKYKGVGTINGSGNYGFILTATDSDVNGGGEVDTFRIKIWDKDNDDLVVYDNKIEASDDSYDGTELGGGNIKVHKGK